MPLKKFVLQPGIVRDGTQYAAEGGWWDCQWVRWHLGSPEMMGGYRRMGNTPYNGTCRALFAWTALDGTPLLAVGTSSNYYILGEGKLNDITPVGLPVSNDAELFGNGYGVVPWGTGPYSLSALSTGVSATGNTTAGSAVVTNLVISPGGSALQVGWELVAKVNATTVALGTIVSVDSSTQVTLDTPATATATGAAIVFAKEAVNFQMRLWSQMNFGEDLFICDKDMPDGLYYWDYDRNFPAATTQNPRKLSAMASPAPYVGRQVFITQDRHAVVLGASAAGTGQQDLMNVWWSHIERIADVPDDPTLPAGNGKAWQPLDTNEAGTYRLGIGSYIVGGKPTRLENLIWTDRALYSMRYVGAPYIFGFTLLAENISICGMNAIADTGTTLFWMGRGEFYAYSGAAEVLPCPVRDYVFSDINMPYSSKFFGGINRGFGEVWFFYCSASSTEIDRYVTYNWPENLWYFGKLTRTAWLDPAIEQWPIAASGGLLYNHEFGMDADGQPLQAFVESADLDLEDGHHFVFARRMMPDVHFANTGANPNPSVDVTIKFKPGPEMPPSKTVTANYAKQSGMIYVRGRGRAATFRIESIQTGQWWRVGNMRADIREDGRH